MSFRTSFRRILQSRNSRWTFSNPISDNAHPLEVAESVFHTGFMVRSYGASLVGTDATRIAGRSHIYKSYGSRAAVADGWQSLGRQHTRGCSPSYASGLRPMHWIAFSSYRQQSYHRESMWKIKNLNRNAGFELIRARSRFYSGGPDLSSLVLWTLIGANVAVYAMWQNVNYGFMEKHFTVSIDSVLSGRLHTLFTSAFSQKNMDHLLSNLIGLYFFGSEIARIFGGRYLLTLYLAGAIGGSVGHMFYYAYVYPWFQNIPRRFYNSRYTPGSLGASGAVTTVMLLHIFLYPKHTIMFQMFIPMPAALMGAIIIGRDLWLAKQGDTDISVGCHLGGAVVALLAFLLKRA
eukprot:c19598_g1_i1 orf=323-1366(+)